MPAFTVFGEPELNRTRQFVAAAKATGNKVEVISYAQVLSGNLDWRQLIESRLVRLESPGRDFLVELALLRRGESIQTDPRFAHLDQTALHALQRDPGLILATRQWYLGWQSLMEEFAKARAQSGVHFLNSPEDIMVMFDKQACHARLASAGVSVPDSLPIPANFEELAAMMIQNGWHRAFLKPSHGSAASGVVALALGNDQMMATTAVEISSTGKSTKLYSTRRLRTYRQTHEIKQLIDALCLERLHIEKWVPKAGFEGRTFDARVVVIRGRACHIIIRRAANSRRARSLRGRVNSGPASGSLSKPVLSRSRNVSGLMLLNAWLTE